MAEPKRVYQSILDLIACPENPTPMVKVGLRVNPNERFGLYPKLERYNPFSSVKDRIALAMIRSAEKYVNPNQYENELNVRAHYEATGPEIWEQTAGKVGYFFAGFGTCGTITGVGRYEGTAVAISPDDAFKYVSFYAPYVKDQSRP